MVQETELELTYKSRYKEARCCNVLQCMMYKLSEVY